MCGGDAPGAVELAGRDGGGDGGHRQRLVAERAVGDRGDDATSRRRRRTRRRRSPSAATLALELARAASCACTSCAAASARAHTTFTGAPVMRAARSQSACSGREVDDLAVEPADLHAHRLPADLDRAALALELDAVQVRDPHAERARLAQHRLATAARRPGRASADSMKPGRPRFIWIGVVQTSSAPAAKHAAAASGASSGMQVVEVGLDQRDRPRRGRGLGADDHAHDVRAARRRRACRRRSRRPRAVIAGQRAVAVGERGDERRAGGRDELQSRSRRRRSARPRAARASRARAAAAGRGRR